MENTIISKEAVEAERARLPPADFAREFEARFIDGDVVECACGYPKANGRSVVVVADEKDLEQCLNCGSSIDEDGQALGHTARDGVTSLKVVVLGGRAKELEAERAGVLAAHRIAAQDGDDGPG